MSNEEIAGGWLEHDRRLIRDEACEKIERLTSKMRTEVAHRDAGWTTHYRDPATADY